MSCPLCPQKLTYDSIKLIHKACVPCERQLRQMMAGFRGVMTEARPKKAIWDNTAAYMEWISQITEADTAKVQLKKSNDYIAQRCDTRDMRRVVGLPKFLPLEQQVFTAWIEEGVKDEKIQEVLGFTYSQLFHVKKVIRVRLQKQMAYYRQIQKLERENNK